MFFTQMNPFTSFSVLQYLDLLSLSALQKAFPEDSETSNLIKVYRVCRYFNSQPIRSLYSFITMASQQQHLFDFCRVITLKGDPMAVSFVSGALHFYETLSDRLKSQLPSNERESLLELIEGNCQLHAPELIREHFASVCSSPLQIRMASIWQHSQTQQTLKSRENYSSQCDPLDDQISEQMEEEQKTFNPELASILQQLLHYHLQSLKLYLSTISNPFDRLSELLIHFSVFRNNLLVYEQRCPGLDGEMGAAVKEWRETMGIFENENIEVFLQIYSKLRGQSKGIECEQGAIYEQYEGRLEELAREFVAYAVDLSIRSEQIVWSGHSEEPLGAVYLELQKRFIDYLGHTKNDDYLESVRVMERIGLRPRTIGRVVDYSRSKDLDYMVERTIRRAVKV